jgi:hypothetical protein
MKYLLTIAFGLAMLSIFGCMCGLCIGLDFKKWSPWLLLLPQGVAYLLVFISACLFMKKHVK